MQAELVTTLISIIRDDVRWWYPNTLIYADEYMRFPLFVRATQRKYFEKLKSITGIDSPDTLKAKFDEGCKKIVLGDGFWSRGNNFLRNLIKIDRLGTLK
ncbi:MAG TPA: hypothetical protein VMW66_04750 [Elusimicrobiales bacterium]|nr:hypothetical protein [Elusimicrobiales bacterium]